MNRRPYPTGPQIGVPPMTKIVKVMLILCGLSFVLQLSLASLGYPIEGILGFVPAYLAKGFLWQPFTYVFLHAGIFHLLFNLLILWSIGAELEGLWGSKTFASYLLVCGLGAALFHGLFSLAGFGTGLNAPVVGSSGIVFGLLLAYGILFGERTMYFFMLFPMQAKYFVMLLGGVEIISSVFYSKSGVAHLAHLGGMLFGFGFLVAMARWRQRSKAEIREAQEMKERQKRLKKAGHLKLVKGDDEDSNDPSQWN
jgi:membrane associated rhomboid family serine protease